MASERLSRTIARLDVYYEAELAVLSGQSYRIGTRELERADLAEIRKAIAELEKQKEELTAQEEGKGARKAYRITLRDL